MAEISGKVKPEADFPGAAVETVELVFLLAAFFFTVDTFFLSAAAFFLLADAFLAAGFFWVGVFGVASFAQITR